MGRHFRSGQDAEGDRDARLSHEVDALLKDPEVVKIFQANQIDAPISTAQPFTKQIKKETDAWENVIKNARHQGET